jgi:crossover junction endodeoxyribonuclease RuvC
MMVKVLLPKADPKSPDAADALALALTHAQHRTRPRLLHSLG